MKRERERARERGREREKTGVKATQRVQIIIVIYTAAGTPRRMLENRFLSCRLQEYRGTPKSEGVMSQQQLKYVSS
jgi:hypothetical protein